VGAGLGLAYLISTYRLAAMVRPATVALYSVGFYFGVYRGLAKPMMKDRFQASLNNTASQLAPKYGIQLANEL